uniref:uncharacterized protein LOC120340399 n=1 Tax=Styela clava TaxID=7725 RepID=UPI00193A7392|nr:uncharacterized protein LOC120340399 [Styela clava]
MPFLKRSKVQNVFSWEELMTIFIPSQCGRIIHLQHAPPPNGLEKLKSVISESKLEQIILIGCFSMAKDTSEVLEVLRRNKVSKKIHLNLHWNKYDDECILVLIELMYSGIVRSLVFPDDMDAVNAERLLEVINKTEDLELQTLNLSGAVLNEHSLEYIAEILRKRKIEKHFNMSNCKRTEEASLTEENYKTLKKAAEKGNKWYKRNLQIEWFSFVGDIDVTKCSHFELMFKNTIEHLFNSETRTKTSFTQEVVKLNVGMAWQLVKPGSKRSRNRRAETESTATAEKRQKTNLEVDEITDMFETRIGVGANPLENKADKEIDGVAENNPPHPRCFERPPNTSSGTQPTPSQEAIPQTAENHLNRFSESQRSVVYIQNFNANNVNTGHVCGGGGINVGDSPRGQTAPRTSVSDGRTSENESRHEIR